MDWPSFWRTLLATLAGAGVGVFGVWWAFHLQSRGQYTVRLDDALARVIVELAQRNTDIDKYLREASASEDETADAPPSNLPLLASMEVALMLSRGDDFHLLNHLVHRAYTAIQGGHLSLQAGANGMILGAIERWRSEQWPRDKVLQTFDTAAAFATRLGPPPPA